MSLKSKINTLFWYLRNPKYYNQLYRLVSRRVFYSPKENSRKESEKWCEENAVSTDDALRLITGEQKIPVTELYKDIFGEAKNKLHTIPVVMGGGGNISALFHLCEYVQAKNVIETGVANGWSTLSILLSLQKRPGAKLISTDMPYAKMNNEDYVGFVVPENLKSQWELIREADITGLIKALNKMKSIDLCHYDSDKSYAGRKWAYPKLWKRLREGGIFVSDDIGDNIGFKDFVENKRLKPIIIKMDHQYVGIIVKNKR